ncbi:MAG: stage V sporulation protein AB [Tyzzerella sp.]|nr:stage V sporulation protein AB [Tyzzerella sp.]
MWGNQILNQVLLVVIGLSSGVVVAGGLFGFIVSLGVVSDLADRTHTGHMVLLYEDIIALGGIVGNLWYVYQFQFGESVVMLGIFGLFAGIFVGCWTMAIAEILNVFPIFIRRGKLVRAVPYIILGLAIGKGAGNLIYFILGW